MEWIQIIQSLLHLLSNNPMESTSQVEQNTHVQVTDEVVNLVTNSPQVTDEVVNLVTNGPQVTEQTSEVKQQSCSVTSSSGPEEGRDYSDQESSDETEEDEKAEEEEEEEKSEEEEEEEKSEEEEHEETELSDKPSFILKIPKASEFAAARQEAMRRQKEAEEKAVLEKAEADRKAREERKVAKKLAREKRVADQTREIEAAFSNCSTKTPEVRVVIDGEKQFFEKEVEKAVLRQGYNIEYVVDKKEPGKTIAHIYPASQNSESYLIEALMDLFSIGNTPSSFGGLGSLMSLDYGYDSFLDLLAPRSKSRGKRCVTCRKYH